MRFGTLYLQEVAVKQPSVGRQHHGVVRLMKDSQHKWPVFPERVHERGASDEGAKRKADKDGLPGRRGLRDLERPKSAEERISEAGGHK